MSTTHKYATPGSVETLMDTGLNSLGNGSRQVSAAVANDTDLNLYADIECSFASAVFTGGGVDIYLLQSLDGTNYEDGGTGVTPTAQCLLGRIPFRGATAAQIHSMRGIILPPTKFKILAINNTGVALASSGNTITMRRYNEQDA